MRFITVSLELAWSICNFEFAVSNHCGCLSGFLWNLKYAPLYSLAALPDSTNPASIRTLKKNLSWLVSGALMMQSSNTPGRA